MPLGTSIGSYLNLIMEFLQLIDEHGNGWMFLVNCFNLLHCMRISMASFRWKQSSMLCLWHLWNRQYLVLSTHGFVVKALGYLIPASFRSAEAISTSIFSLDTVRGVYLKKDQHVLFPHELACLPFSSLRMAYWRAQQCSPSSLSYSDY